MSKKLAAQALDALLSTQNSSLSKSEPTKAAPKKKRSKKDQLPKTKTGLKKIKHELRYGHSVKRNQEAQQARENPLGMRSPQSGETRGLIVSFTNNQFAPLPFFPSIL